MRLGPTLAVVIAFAGGCLGGSSSTVCENGVICPRGTVCDAFGGGCVPEGKQAACDGLDSGDPCEFLDVAGVCMDGLCATDVCGNGVVDADEECDCGAGPILRAECVSQNSNEAGASCRMDCTAHCGDGVKNQAEECDIGAPANGLCVDIGFDRGALTCDSACTQSFASCGSIGFKERPIPAFIDTYNSVASTADGHVFVAGNSFAVAVISEFDGQSWARTELGEGVIAHVFATSSAEAYAVANNGHLWTFDGSQWIEEVPEPNGYELRQVLPTPEGLLVATEQGMRRFDGTWQTEQPTVPLWGNYGAVGGRYPDAVFAASRGLPVIDHRELDGTWTPVGGVDFDGRLVRDFATVGQAVYAVGDAGLVARYDGAWTVLASPLSDDLIAAWGAPSGVFAASNQGAVFRINGDKLTPIEFDATGRAINGVSGAGDKVTLLTRDDNFAMSVFEARGDHFTTVVTAKERVVASPIGGIHQTPSAEAFLVGAEGLALLYDGLSFTEFSLGPSVQLGSVFARSTTDAYAAGVANGLAVLFHFDGVGWTDRTGMLPTELQESTTLSISGRADEALLMGASGVAARLDKDDVFIDLTNEAAASSGAAFGQLTSDGAIAVHRLPAGVFVFHHDGTEWTELFEVDTLPSAGFATSRDNVYLGDTRGTIYRFDGQSVTTTLLEGGIDGISGTGPTDIFAITFQRTVHHFDGTQWAPVAAPRLPYTRVDVLDDSVLFLDFNGDIVRLLRSGVW